MRKYFFSTFASGILLLIAFTTLSHTIAFTTLSHTQIATEVEESRQMDSSISMVTSASKMDRGVSQIDKLEVITINSLKATPAALILNDFSYKSVKATVKGTSTLHDWESEVTIMEGKGSFQLNENVLASINDAEIKITVHGIISEKGSKMDNKTYEAFKSDKYPYIIYTFSKAIVKIDSQVVSIKSTGTLAMAGASKSISLLAQGKELPNGDLQLSVSKTIKMTDYNMKPPTMFLGTIKVGDEITVNFDFVLSKIKK
jgi:hypothetical protein